MDVNFLDDTKFGFIDAKFGAEGVVIILRLWQLIYNDKGYYCNWSEDDAVLFARRYGYGKKWSEVQAIVDESLKRGIFDKFMYNKHHILTSRRIQEVYTEAVKRRNSCSINDEYDLLSATSDTKKCMQKDEKCMQKQENCMQNADKNTKSADIFEQNKINKNKINTPPLSQGESGSPEGERGRDSLRDFILKGRYDEDETSELLRLTDDADEHSVGGVLMVNWFVSGDKRYTIGDCVRSLQAKVDRGEIEPRWSVPEWDAIWWIRNHIAAPNARPILEAIDNNREIIGVVMEAVEAVKKAAKTQRPILLPGEFISERLKRANG